MKKRRARLAIAIAFLLAAQTASFGQSADQKLRSEDITQDKTGKYVAIESVSPLLLDKGWFSDMRCATPAGGIITAKIGQSVFHLPDTSVRSVITAGSLVLTRGADGKYLQYYAANAGCAENPIELTFAELIPPASGAAPELSIKATPDHQGLTRTAQGLLSLREHADERGCQSGGNHTLLICSGSDGTGPVAYILAMDKTLTQQSGAPLYMKCNLAPTLVCGVSDDLPEGITYTAVVTGDVKDFSVKRIQDAQAAAHKVIEGLRGH